MTNDQLLAAAIDLLKDIDWAYKLTPGRSAKIAQIIEEYEKGGAMKNLLSLSANDLLTRLLDMGLNLREMVVKLLDREFLIANEIDILDARDLREWLDDKLGRVKE